MPPELVFQLQLRPGYVAWLLFFRLRGAQAQVDGPIRSATCDRHVAQFPLLRAGHYSAGGRQS